MPPEGQENPSAAAPAARAEAAPGKMRVDQKTLDQFNSEQVSALQQANLERTTRGNPNWLIGDFVRCNPGKFPDVDFDLDNAEAAERAKATALPLARVDERPAR